ncbi:MAG: 3-phosphoserine/phosphohydroxythreonine transaminase [Clostridia bacterium]|nr:3-phosphoserine/phosphohydroxythreonine transaminase [Clostridia bacterium]
MARVYNFSAGPSMLPLSVLKKAQAELLEYGTTGQSVMEMSHRSKEYQQIIETAEADLREIMNIPDDYDVFFTQGGGFTQFAAVPLNLMNKNNKADYIVTGQWAKKAFEEAGKYGDAKAAASSADKNFSYIPKTKRSDFRTDADYVYICMNNTIYGTKFNELPDTGDIPLVADISSCMLSEPLDVTKFGLLFGGAQKNVAPAGVVMVIAKKDMLGNAMDITPTMLNYKIQADAKSLFNTPPCYNIYMAGLVFKWIKEIGGINAVYENNKRKAKLLYDFLDSSKMFKGTVEKADRSLMNVPFVTDSEELNKKFIAESAANGLVNLKGHRTVGGMRASIYNAMPYEGVKALVEFMDRFEKENSL